MLPAELPIMSPEFPILTMLSSSITHCPNSISSPNDETEILYPVIRSISSSSLFAKTGVIIKLMAMIEIANAVISFLNI